MPHFKITLAYDGGDYVGWQRQAAGVSIQGLVEEALGILDGREVMVAGASRTDSGVHALGQVASATIERPIDGPSLVRAVNARLPQAVRVLDAVEVPAAFHARFDARAKTYRYRVWNGDVLSPFEARYAWHAPAPRLDVAAMDAAARHFEGRHDFAAFQASGGTARSTERTIVTSRVRTADGVQAGTVPLVVYEVQGQGFLRHMVRTIVGTLVEVGRGRRAPEWAADVLGSRDRARTGQTAPALGLFLVRVDYE